MHDIAREFTDLDGKVRINSPEKAQRYREILRERGYKPIEEKPLQNFFHVIHNAENWEECVIVFPKGYKEGFTYRDYRNAGYPEAGTSAIGEAT